MIQGLERTQFDPSAADQETVAFVAELEARLSTVSPPQEVGIQAVREAARSGQSFFGPVVHSDIAADRVIDSPAGGLTLRVFTPPVVKGVYLHFHGGGWAQGASDLQDPRLERTANECEVAVISVDYRLAPEYPYPAGPDDAETAALWLAGNANAEFGTENLVIGGESAGAHLASVALLRLRDRHGLADAYKGANLLYGAYDLTLTPSSRAWGDRYVVLSRRTSTGAWICSCRLRSAPTLTFPPCMPTFPAFRPPSFPWARLTRSWTTPCSCTRAGSPQATRPTSQSTPDCPTLSHSCLLRPQNRPTQSATNSSG